MAKDTSLRLAQGLRKWQAEHPVVDLGLGFVPVVGQAYGLASAAAAGRDPTASKLEKGLAAASVLPIGKMAGALRKIVVGEKMTKGVPAYEASLKEAKKKALEYRRAAQSADPSKGAVGVSDLVQGDPRINDQLAKETGWWYDPDSKKFMTELDDSKSMPDFEYMDQATANNMFGMPGQNISLADALRHPELEKLPEAQKMMAQTNVENIPGRAGQGFYREGEELINFEGAIEPQNMSQIRDVLLHEPQHTIAAREGFELGSNPKASGSYEAYLKDPGEMLARVTALRRNMTPEARRKFPFHRHMDAERYRLSTPGEESRYARDKDLERMLKERNLDPEEMLVPGP